MTSAARRGLGALAIGTMLATMPLHAAFDASGGVTLTLAKAFAKDGGGGSSNGGGGSGGGNGGGGGGNSGNGNSGGGSSGSSGGGNGGGSSGNGGSGNGGGSNGGGDDGGSGSGRSGSGNSGSDDNSGSGSGRSGDDDNGSSGGGDDNGRGGDDNGGRDRGGDDSSGDDNRGRGRGGDDNRGDDDRGRGGVATAPAAAGGSRGLQVVKFERTTAGVEITYSNGVREEIEAGRFQQKNAAGRTVIERPATQQDVARLNANARNSGIARVPASSGAPRVEVSGGEIEVNHPNGWREELAGGRYELKDPNNNTVVERPATAADIRRLRALAGG